MAERVEIQSIEDHGTIVQLWVVRELTGALFPINFDHRPFKNFQEGWAAAGCPTNVLYDPATHTVEI